jgi:hypothetical protein
LIISPQSGATQRIIAELATELAQGNPDKKVFYTFSDNVFEVSADDTLTDVIINKMKKDHNPTYRLKIKDTNAEVIEASVKPSDYEPMDIFRIALQAIYTSREHDNKPVALTFNGHQLRITGRDEADIIEASVPQQDRTIPPTGHEQHRPIARRPAEQVGRFKINNL